VSRAVAFLHTPEADDLCAVRRDVVFLCVDVHVCQSVDDYEMLGTTQDDSVGEAFDKVARMLRLGYHQRCADEGYTEQAREEAEATHFEPIQGHYGAVLESLASEGDEFSIQLPVPLQQKPVRGNIWTR